MTQPPSGQPNQYGPNQYGPNQYGPNQYGPNQYGPNQYGPNQYGPNQYGPNQYGQHGGAQPPTQPDAQRYGAPQYGAPAPAPPGTYQPGAFQPGAADPGTYQSGHQLGGLPGGVPQKKGVSSRALLLVGGVVLVLLIGLIAGLLMVNRSTPEKTVRDYLAAVNAKDCEAILKLFVEGESRDAQCTPADLAEIPELTIKTLESTETGDNATVTVTVEAVGVETKTIFSLIRKDGKWLINRQDNK